MSKPTSKPSKLSASELLIKIMTALAMLLYIYCVLHITLLDRNVGTRRHVLRPLWEVRTMFQSGNYTYWSGQIGGNLIMLFPLGFLLPILSGKFKNIMLTTVAGFAFSVLIEFTQYYTGRGLFESDDIMHNTIGAFAGCLFYLIVVRLISKDPDTYEYNTE